MLSRSRGRRYSRLFVRGSIRISAALIRLRKSTTCCIRTPYHCLTSAKMPLMSAIRSTHKKHFFHMLAPLCFMFSETVIVDSIRNLEDAHIYIYVYKANCKIWAKMPMHYERSDIGSTNRCRSSRITRKRGVEPSRRGSGLIEDKTDKV